MIEKFANISLTNYITFVRESRRVFESWQIVAKLIGPRVYTSLQIYGVLPKRKSIKKKKKSAPWVTSDLVFSHSPIPCLRLISHRGLKLLYARDVFFPTPFFLSFFLLVFFFFSFFSPDIVHRR